MGSASAAHTSVHLIAVSPFIIPPFFRAFSYAPISARAVPPTVVTSVRTSAARRSLSALLLSRPRGGLPLCNERAARTYATRLVQPVLLPSPGAVRRVSHFPAAVALAGAVGDGGELY